MCVNPPSPSAARADAPALASPTQAISPRMQLQASPRAHLEQDHRQMITDLVKISKIRENDFITHGRFPKNDAKPRINDKEKALYNSRDLRPARKLNVNSKKRLNELLKLPSLRIEAGDLHPSRQYGIVPSQNLRVDHTLQIL